MVEGRAMSLTKVATLMKSLLSMLMLVSEKVEELVERMLMLRS
jgi:hypothetical protein